MWTFSLNWRVEIGSLGDQIPLISSPQSPVFNKTLKNPGLLSGDSKLCLGLDLPYSLAKDACAWRKLWRPRTLLLWPDEDGFHDGDVRRHGFGSHFRWIRSSSVRHEGTWTHHTSRNCHGPGRRNLRYIHGNRNWNSVLKKNSSDWLHSGLWLTVG